MLATKPLLYVGASLLVAACGGASSSLPGSPTPPVPSVSTPATISGIVSAVTASTGPPVEGVRVEESGAHSIALTDANGFFTLARAPGPLSISLTKAGYFSETISLPETATYLLLRIVPIPPTFTLSGRVTEVTSAGRRPVEGVMVAGQACEPRRCESRQAFTTADGFYTLRLYEGDNTLSITKTGYDLDGVTAVPDCLSCVAIALAGDTSFDIQLIRR